MITGLLVNNKITSIYYRLGEVSMFWQRNVLDIIIIGSNLIP